MLLPPMLGPVITVLQGVPMSTSLATKSPPCRKATGCLSSSAWKTYEERARVDQCTKEKHQVGCRGCAALRVDQPTGLGDSRDRAPPKADLLTA